VTPAEASAEAAVEQTPNAANGGMVVTVALSPTAVEALCRICDHQGVTYAGAVGQALQSHAQAVAMTQAEVSRAVNPVADAMAQAAKVDPRLPYSFVLDAWRLMEEAAAQLRILGCEINCWTYGTFLDRAVLTWVANPEEYQINPGASPVSVL
jgi:hypothetical protein